jgi:hypothetical protein
MTRVNLNDGQYRNLDDPLIERPPDDAPRSDRVAFHFLRWWVGPGIAVHLGTLGLIAVGLFIVTPAAAAVVFVFGLVAILIYKS